MYMGLTFYFSKDLWTSLNRKLLFINMHVLYTYTFTCIFKTILFKGLLEIPSIFGFK